MNSWPTFDLHGLAHEAMRNYGFEPQFDPSLINETERLAGEIHPAAHLPEVVDLRARLWSSIDNVESRDLDQLEYCERRPNKEIFCCVAIADVDIYVPLGSRADRRAYNNGTSVYTGVDVFSMLPDILSADRSSLIEGEDRLAMVIEFFVLSDGSFRPGTVYPALVHNKAKLVYEEVGDWLEGTGRMPDKIAADVALKEQLVLQDEVARRLDAMRGENGALEFETIEARAVMAGEAVKDLVIQKKNRARLIIENLMVAANGTMSRFLEENNSPTIQRVLREPEQWPRIRELAAEYKTDLPVEPDAKALRSFLTRQRRAQPQTFPDLSLALVKLLGPGEYMMLEPGKSRVGHFGLAVQDYTHSTAPNRRYVDLVVQRLVKSVLAKQPAAYSKTVLQDIAVWCTDRDKASKKVERFMRKVAGAILMQGKVGEVFEGIVTGASEKGTYVRLFHPPVEGRVVRSEAGLNVGQKVMVRLKRVVPEKGYIDFERIGRGGKH